MEVGQLARGPRVVAVERPHGEHAQPLGAGEDLEAIRVGQGKHLRRDVVDAQHRRHTELVPAKRLALAGEQARHLREGGVGRVDGVLPHCLELRRRGASAVVHRHHVHSIDLHAGHKSSLHDVQAILREPLGQHGQRQPHPELRTGLLHQGDGVHLELDRLGFGDGGALDIEVEFLQLQGIDHVAVGRRQRLGAQAPLGVCLRQALPRRTPQRHHHIAAGCPQRVDLPLDGERLLVRAPGREHVVPGPPQLAGGGGLHESQRQEPDAVLPSQAVEVWHRILPHIDVGSEKLLLPQVDARRRWRGGRRRYRWRDRRRGRRRSRRGTNGREDEAGRSVSAGSGGEADALHLTHRERAIPGGPLDDILRACATDDLGVPDVVDRAVVIEGELPIGERRLRVVGERQFPLETRSPVIHGGVADGEREPFLELIEGGKRRPVAVTATGLGGGAIGKE